MKRSEENHGSRSAGRPAPGRAPEPAAGPPPSDPRALPPPPVPPPVSLPADAASDADAALDRLVAGCAVVPHDLLLVLLAPAGIGGLRPARLTHADPRRAEVLHARLRAELHLPTAAAPPTRSPGPTEPASDGGKGGLERAGTVGPGGTEHGQAVGGVDVGGLPEPVRAVLAEDGGGPVVVVPVAGRWSSLGVLVVRAPVGSFFDDRHADALFTLARVCGAALENARLTEDSAIGAAFAATTRDAVVAVDRHDVVTRWSPGAETVYGVPAAEAVGRPLPDLLRTRFGEDDALTARSTVRGRGSWSGRVRQTVRGGRVVDVDARVSRIAGPGGEFLGLLAVNRDVTAASREMAVARAETGFAQDVMDALDTGVAVLDRAGVVERANTRWRSVAGAAARERCVCGPVPEGENWLSALRSAPGPQPAALAAEVAGLLRGRRSRVHLDCDCPAGGADVETAVQVTGLDAATGGAVVTWTRAGPRRPRQDDLTFRATHDELTGLPNRAALMEGLAGSLRRLDGKQKLAVLFCDLDGFKDINDGLGHAVGDQVLVAVARRLRRRCRSADVVARFGGDEFVVVLAVDDVSQAVAMADRIVELLDEPIVVGEAEVAPGVSVGITVVDVPPDDDDPVGTLLRDADTAMYHAKGRGRGRYELFDASLRENIEERLELAAALHRAVGDEELEIVYQARRYCGDRRIAGVEALLRWRHPDLGLLEPEVFIPIAERTGRIVELGEWVLRRGLFDLAGLPDRRIGLAVNVSPRQLVGGRLVRTVAGALAESGIAPSRLVLEITENAFVDDPQAVRAVLAELRELGVSVALDDFGTGWSSLQYLRTLPVDVLKVDRSFVADLTTDPDACAVVSAVLGLGHGMGLVVVAEGVENAEQLEVLRNMGCDEYQGFLDDGPTTLADVLARDAQVTRRSG